MSAVLDTEVEVYYCVICGPCSKLIGERADIIVHVNIPHPEEAVVPDYEDTVH